MYGPGYQRDHSLPLYLCGCVEVGAGLDKWDSAVLLLIIMPRLSLTDTRDLSSAKQTYISPLAAHCVRVYLCVCVCVCLDTVCMGLCEGHAWHPSLSSTAEV